MTVQHVQHLLRSAETEGRRRLDAHQEHGHRGIMRAITTAVVLRAYPGSALADDPALVRAASERAAWLEALQQPDGLFAGGDNLNSPPDSAFTINDATRTIQILRAGTPPWPDDLEERLLAVVRSAAPALRTGGLHTPNHRWELASALAQSGVLLDDPTLLDRARQWLQEGIDVDDDGLYSERSPNYAAHVSNPSLTILAELLDRPELHEIVHQNLHAQLDLTDRTGVVETVHSRRQDQHGPFPLGAFLAQLRRAALRWSCARCARGARLAAETAGVDAVDVLAQQLLDPALAGPLPPAEPWPRSSRRYFREARLLRESRSGGDTEFVVHGGSDVRAAGRIASGLACNPTFLRLRAGAVAVDSVRLSRDFFGLGPFRASDMAVTGNEAVLTECASAAYYQPLPASSRRDDGRYQLEHDGRFAAAMSFSQRPHDLVTLTTTVRIALLDDGATLTITTDGPATPHVLEIALTAGGELTGATPLDPDRFVLAEGTARYALDRSELSIEWKGHEPGPTSGYDPGEAYTFTNGTDAVAGTRLYLPWHSPGTVEVRLTHAPARRSSG